jgi:hypothetical protein
MTTLIYNNVVMTDCELLGFNQEVQYDDSKTDVICSRFNIRVASTLTAKTYQANSFGINTFSGTTVVQRMHDIRTRLEQARGDFWLLVDSCVTDEKHGATVLDQPLLIATGQIDGMYEGTQYGTEMNVHPFSTNNQTVQYGIEGTVLREKVLDCDNGPKPKKVVIQQIFGGRAMRVEFEIEVCLRLCHDFTERKPIVDGALEPDNRIVSNRWYIEETKDENWITTKSLQGTLRVAHSAYWPHAMRFLCVPPLLKGYKRINQNFASEPTGLILKYRIDDRQAHAAPPAPAIAWTGHHVETATGNEGLTKNGEVQLTLTGPPGVNKQELIAVAGKVIVNRIRGLAPPNPDNPTDIDLVILKNASIVDVLHEPTIEMRVQVQYMGSDPKSLALRVKQMGSPLNESQYENDPFTIAGYHPRSFPIPLPYDSQRPAGIFACYLQNPCSVWHDIPGGIGPESTEIEPPTYPGYGEADESDPGEYESPGDLDEDDPPTSTDSNVYKYPYTFVEIESRYLLDNGWIQLPLADPASEKSAALIKLHGRIAKRILTMTAKREGKQPTIPSLNEDVVDHNGYREVLEIINIASKAPKLGPNGYSRTHEFFIELVYLLEKAPSNTDKLRVGSTPLDRFSPNSNWINLGELADQSGHLQWEDGVTEDFPPSDDPPDPPPAV